MGHHKQTKLRRPFIVGEEVEPKSAQGWVIDTIAEIQGAFVIGSTGWRLPATHLKRCMGSSINTQIAKDIEKSQIQESFHRLSLTFEQFKQQTEIFRRLTAKDLDKPFKGKNE